MTNENKNELQVFSHPLFGELEIYIDKNGKEWFPAVDIAKKLGYKDPYDAIKKHCKNKGSAIYRVLTNGGEQEKKHIDEGNLYRLVVKSKLPEAEKFEEWVFEDILPSIRKHGAYMTDDVLEQAISNPDFTIGLLNKLKEERQKRIEAENRNKENEPLVTFATTCLKSKDNILVRELSKIASDEIGTIGEKRLYRKLREWNLIFKHSTEPYQAAIDNGLFVVEEKPFDTPYGQKLGRTTKVTPKGQVYVIERLKKEAL